jgi:hypothetical protein
MTGTWQPWVHKDNPLHNFINQYWRQSWLRAGQLFPDQVSDWMLDVPAGQISWHLMDASEFELL